ncbi:LysE family translocator [Actinomadura atramentaria]|uniref:LysE family translocator n=1 Tax=Actinomadura atramentaria TaxID=1990 RepID=UPI000372D084|nr:LysE family translocator [Actinomadura atramentaria]
MVDLAGYVAVAGVIVVAPGADTLVVVDNALRGGGRSSTATAAGVCCGLTVWAFASLAGLVLLLRAHDGAFTALKIIGAVYLVFLGVRTLWEARSADTAPRPVGGTWRRGALTSLTNPKVGIFYLSFLPQFLPAHGHTVAWGGLLAGIHIALSFACLLAYSLLALRARAAFQRPGWRRALNIVTGSAFCVLGVGAAAAAVA